MIDEDFLAAVTPELIDAELRRRRLLADPVAWCHERLNVVLWSKQQEIARAVAGQRRVAVKSCHAGGKSWLMARLAAWWLDTASRVGEAFVVTSAPTGKQVRAILWREINRAHAAGNLTGRCNQTEWWMPYQGADGSFKEELVAFGQKPQDMDPAAFQGIHAPRVLVIFDEAGGIPVELWEAADSLIANEGSQIAVIGNPDDPTTEFANVCKPGSGWHVVQISAFDTPNFTGEAIPADVAAQLIGRTWVEEKRRKWGEANPLWIAKVLGEFPQIADFGLIPIAWVKAAQERTLEPGLPVELGVDVGGGRDKSVVYVRRGPVVRMANKDTNPDTMQTTGTVIQIMKDTGATKAKVDEIGIGSGVVARGKELGKPFVGVNVGRAAKNPEQYANRRAELAWGLRERFQGGDVDLDPADDDLAAQLCSIKTKPTSRGQVALESKDDYKKRMKTHSPDEFDAVMLAFADEGDSAYGVPEGVGDHEDSYAAVGETEDLPEDHEEDRLPSKRGSQPVSGIVTF